MNVLLDTNILIDYFRGKIELEISPKTSLFISVITEIEILYGASKSNHPQKNIAVLRNFINDFNIQIIPVDSTVAQVFVTEKRTLENQRVKLEDYDLFIAATVISNNLTLASHNQRHFKRIKHLKLIPNI